MKKNDHTTNLNGGRRKVLPEGFWILARTTFEKGGISLKTISELLNVNYQTAQSRSHRERWASPWKRAKESREKTAALVVDLIAKGENCEYRKAALNKLSPSARAETEKAIVDGYHHRQKEITAADANALLKETLLRSKEQPEFLRAEANAAVGDVRELVVDGVPLTLVKSPEGYWELSPSVDTMPPGDTLPPSVDHIPGDTIPHGDHIPGDTMPHGDHIPGDTIPHGDHIPGDTSAIPTSTDTSDGYHSEMDGGTPKEEDLGKKKAKMSLEKRVDELLKGGSMGFGQKGERHKALMAEIASSVIEALGVAVEDSGGLSALQTAGDVEKWDKIARRNLDLEEKKGGMGVLGIVMMGDYRPIPAPAIMGEVARLAEVHIEEEEGIIDVDVELMEDEVS